MMVYQTIDDVKFCVKNEEYITTKLGCQNLKNQLEDENKQMQGIIRDLRDKVGEMSKKYQMAVEKVEEQQVPVKKPTLFHANTV